MFIVQVSQDTKLQVSRIIHRSLEMAGPSVVTLRVETQHSVLLRSPRTEIFALVEFYLGDVLKWLFISDTWEDCIFLIQVSQDAELFKSQ